MADTVGEQDIRAESFSRIVKGFALKNYKLMQLCMVESSSAWTEHYFRENAADLTGGTGSDVKEVPRGGPFPYGEVGWTRVSGVNIKHGMDVRIFWEDVKMNNIPMITRTLLRVARAVTKSVDAVIASVILTEAGNTVAANATWDNSVIADRDPIQDLLNARATLQVDNYDPDKNAKLICHPNDMKNLLGNPNIRNAGQFYTNKVTADGKIGGMLGVDFIETTSVTEGGAQLVLVKQACTWKKVVGMSVFTKIDPGVDYSIRAWEVGQIQVTDPNAICSITGI